MAKDDVPSTARHRGEHNAPQPVQASSPASNYSATSSTRPLSSSRAQTLAPGSSLQTPPATASPQSNGHGPASPMGGGPIGSSWSVPPRPKPGRKPATDEPLTKRKAQNREAQRAFRARKKQTLESMENSLKSKAEIHQEEIAKKDAVIADLNKQVEVQCSHIATLNRKFVEAAAWEKEVASKDREIAFWKERFEAERAARGGMTLSGQNSPPEKTPSLHLGTSQTFQDLDVGCGNCKADGRCDCIEAFAKDPNLSSPTKISTSNFRGHSPADSLSPEQEIDFTGQFSRPKYNSMPKPDDRGSITFLTDQDSTCGFCTDETNCACKIESLQQLSRSEMPPPSQSQTLQNSSSSCPTGPGSCADCMANPRQKAWCETVSRLKAPGAIDITWSRSSSTKMAPIRSRSPNSLPKPPMSTLEPSNPTVGCDEAFRLFDGRLDMESDRMDWIKNLRPVSPGGEKDTIMDTGRKYSAVELESASVIASLTHTMGPLVPRSTDGPNAELVEIADKRRKLINSPSSMQDVRGQSAGSPSLPVSALVNGGAHSISRH
ncbi:uncharacterized protein BDZ99DRAFT_504448 [Mytilinidion resinicola]|uniref:BZIP domain-containing protein n=1 Tax=Mytilinidion resinicola TaxID=574789 RepID=A0A6A6XZD3_9PEZI|nr:uncharacterized protein BDZ99DRAFT_504448 [Mytilinidion resinicola]KAF2801759.1 hypothetical protein BDZ99DRAFT_504448 [Mytilinidion resinicola]